MNKFNKLNKFKTLLYVKISLISLYLALTIPISYFAISELKIFSIITFFFGLFLIISITNDYVITSEDALSYKTDFISSLLGKSSWKIFWKDIKLIKSFPTSQGGKVHYFITNNNKSYLVPQRVENLDQFVSIISNKTKLDTTELDYISPLWTYKFLTYLSLSMIIGEMITFII